MKCTKCNQDKKDLEFAVEKRRSDGSAVYRRECKKCRAEYARIRRKNNPEVDDRIKERMRQWHEQNPDASYTHNLTKNLKQYGLTINEYNEMVFRQGGRCASCGIIPAGVEKRGRMPRVIRLYVDHCHKTGRVRGLLCSGCNTGFGMLGDSVEKVEMLLRYAKKHEILSSSILAQ